MSDNAARLAERLLVLRAQAGDEAALAALIDSFGPRLRYFLRKLLGDPHAAEDACQELWCDAYRGLPRLRDPAAFPAWLYRLARDRAYRELRRRRFKFEPLDETTAPDDSSDDDAFTAEDAGLIHSALDELAPEHREVLVLRFLEDMSYEDISRVACCELGTVRSRLYYAKRALRAAWQRRQPTEDMS